MADLSALADETAERIGAIAERGSSVSRGVALLTTSSTGLAYLVGILVLRGPWRWVWLGVGLVLCAIPAFAAWSADRRLRRVGPHLAETADELATKVGEKAVRDQLFDLAEQDDHHDLDTPLMALGKEFEPLRNAIADDQDDLPNAWASVTAITGLPGLMAVGIVGSFGALLFSVLAVVASLLM